MPLTQPSATLPSTPDTATPAPSNPTVAVPPAATPVANGFDFLTSVFSALPPVQNAQPADPLTAALNANDDPGPYGVNVYETTFVDENRDNREVPTKIYYPDSSEGGPYPVIMLSHGLSGNNDANTYLAEHLTSHGYVVVAAEHVGSNTEAKLEATQVALNQELVAKGFSEEQAAQIAQDAVTGQLSQADIQGAIQSGLLTQTEAQEIFDNVLKQSTDALYRNPEEWANRPQDISFLLDELETTVAANPQLQAYVDLENVAAVGHSYGAYTSLALAGAGVNMPGSDELTSFRDERIDTVFAMSPQGQGDDFAITADSYQMIDPDVAMFTIAGENEISRNDIDNWRMEPYLNSPAEQNYFVSLDGREHRAFSNSGDTQTHENVEGFALTFLDANLKDDPEAIALLEQAPEGETRTENRGGITLLVDTEADAPTPPPETPPSTPPTETPPTPVPPTSGQPTTWLTFG